MTRCISGDEECRTRERRTRNKHRVARPNQSTRDVRTDQAHEANRPCVRNRNRCEEPTHSKKYAPKSDDINADRSLADWSIGWKASQGCQDREARRNGSPSRDCTWLNCTWLDCTWLDCTWLICTWFDCGWFDCGWHPRSWSK